VSAGATPSPRPATGWLPPPVAGFLILGLTLALWSGGSLFRAVAAYRIQSSLLQSEKDLTQRAEEARRGLLLVEERLDQAMAGLLPGSSPLLAQTPISYLVEQAAERSFVRLMQVEPQLPRPEAPGLTALPVRVRVESDMEGLISMLGALERASAYLLVDQFTIQRRGNGADPNRTGEEPEVLESGFTVIGFHPAGVLVPGSADGADIDGPRPVFGNVALPPARGALRGPAVERNPFRIERRPAGARYGMPISHRDSNDPEDLADRAIEGPTFLVLGLAVATDGSSGVLVVRSAAGASRLLAIGDEVDGYLLTGLTPEDAMFQGPSGPITLALGRPRADPDFRRSRP
jgi:hypothetical protein